MEKERHLQEELYTSSYLVSPYAENLQSIIFTVKQLSRNEQEMLTLLYHVTDGVHLLAHMQNI